jgi:hypothetical protein
LIGCQTFLTAAHCLCEDSVTGLILSGKQCNARPDLLDPQGKTVFLQNAGLFEVAAIAIHPRFQFRQRGDLAVLTLTRPVTGVGTSRLNLTEKPEIGTPGTVVGFGLAGAGQHAVGIKRQGQVTTARCIGANDAAHVCFTYDNPLGDPGDRSDTCQGDSGGPLFVDFGTGDVVAGVTSGGDNPSCQVVDHAFDADVFLDRSWIERAGGVDLDRGFCGDLTPLGGPGTAALGEDGSLDAAVPRQVFSFTVPAGIERLRLALNAETGADFLFAAQAGPRPVPGSVRCQGETAGSPAFCEVLAPAPGPWTVIVNRVRRAGRFQLTATLLPHLAMPGPCFPSATALCLDQGRFRVEVAWQTPFGTTGAGTALPISDLSGAFSFFPPGSVEVAVKVLDACTAGHGHFWLFAAGLTDVQTLLTVTDTQTGAVRAYPQPQGVPFGPLLDTAAFACP